MSGAVFHDGLGTLSAVRERLAWVVPAPSAAIRALRADGSAAHLGACAQQAPSTLLSTRSHHACSGAQLAHDGWGLALSSSCGSGSTCVMAATLRHANRAPFAEKLDAGTAEHHRGSHHRHTRNVERQRTPGGVP